MLKVSHKLWPEETGGQCYSIKNGITCSTLCSGKKEVKIEPLNV